MHARLVDVSPATPQDVAGPLRGRGDDDRWHEPFRREREPCHRSARVTQRFDAGVKSPERTELLSIGQRVLRRQRQLALGDSVNGLYHDVSSLHACGCRAWLVHDDGVAIPSSLLRRPMRSE